MSGHVPWRRWCHIHSLGRSCGVQLYLRHRAAWKVSLWTANPWATMSNAVSQLWAPFSLPSSATLCRCWQSGLHFGCSFLLSSVSFYSGGLLDGLRCHLGHLSAAQYV